MNPIKVLLVIEVRLIANLFASVLEDESGMEIAGFVFTLEDALEFLETHQVDVNWIHSSLSVRVKEQSAFMVATRNC